MNIEIYEYKLKDYPATLNLLLGNGWIHGNVEVKTNKIDSAENDCGIINTDKDTDLFLPTKYDFNPGGYPEDNAPLAPIYTTYPNMVRSCDPISGNLTITRSSTEGMAGKFPEEMFQTSGVIERPGRSIPLELSTHPDKLIFTLGGITSDDLIKYSNLNGAKKMLHTPFSYDGLVSFLKLYNVTYVNSLCDYLITILQQDWTDNTVRFDYNSIDNCQYNTLIKILRPDVNQKYIIFGDFHGSYHTFLRHLLRFRLLGILDNKCRLQDNYHLIFLGDLIDRGNHGYELILLTFLLKIINPYNVHLNRGNHEESIMNSKESFITEVKYKLGNIDGSAIHTKINNILLYQHSALLIKNPLTAKYAYLAHGGLPLLNPSGTIELHPIFNTVIGGGRIPLTNNIIIDNVHVEVNAAGINVNSIRWSDFHGGPSLVIKPSRPAIGTMILNQTDELIEIIIRGHQDGEYNTKLIVEGVLPSTRLGDAIFTDIKSLPTYRRADVNNDIQCYGFTHKITVNAANKIIVNDLVDRPFIKVLTISNNTDVMRELDRDSYAILRYTDSYDHELNRCVLPDSDEDSLIKTNRAKRMGLAVDDSMGVATSATASTASTAATDHQMTGGNYKQYRICKNNYINLLKYNIY